MQLNAICRLAKFMGNKKKIAMITVLFTPVLTNVLLSGISAHMNYRKDSKNSKTLPKISTQ